MDETFGTRVAAKLSRVERSKLKPLATCFLRGTCKTGGERKQIGRVSLDDACKFIRFAGVYFDHFPRVSRECFRKKKKKKRIFDSKIRPYRRRFIRPTTGGKFFIGRIDS